MDAKFSTKVFKVWAPKGPKPHFLDPKIPYFNKNAYLIVR